MKKSRRIWGKGLWGGVEEAQVAVEPYMNLGA